MAVGRFATIVQTAPLEIVPPFLRLAFSPGITAPTVSVLGQAGQTYELEATSDFRTWAVLARVTLAGASTNVFDSGAGGARLRFYRASSR
jgi:hypothetical protein